MAGLRQLQCPAAAAAARRRKRKKVAGKNKTTIHYTKEKLKTIGDCSGDLDHVNLNVFLFGFRFIQIAGITNPTERGVLALDAEIPK